MPDKVATVVFDSSVNSGQGRSIKTLQKSVGAHIDGIIGPETISMLKDFDDLVLTTSFLDNKEKFYRAIVANDPTQEEFLGGWLRRVSFLRDFVNGVKTLEQIRKSW
jgi:lysozyme family protein